MTANDTHSRAAGESRRRSDSGSRRRWLFRLWIGATGLLALYVALAAPFANADLVPESYLAYSLPPLMILLLGLSLLWLGRLVGRGRDSADALRRNDRR